MDKIVSLCKRRGFVFPGSEIYGGLANSWDYGPLGTELKNNIKQLWWKKFVQQRDDVVGVDAALIMNPKVWQASGHVATFNDPLVEDKETHERFRLDHFLEENGVQVAGMTFEQMVETLKKMGLRSPKGNELTEPKKFNMMFKTNLGPVDDEDSKVYLRPETAQGMFVNFKNILGTSRKQLPFGIAQIGPAFRNEITPGNFIFRTREFEQMEIEYFVRPEEWEKWFEYWLDQQKEWCKEIGIFDQAVFIEIPEADRAHYSKRSIDTEFKFPFGQKELYGLAYRTDYDLKNHQEKSGQSLEYTDPQTGEKVLPHCIEPTWGVSRTFLAVLTSAYDDSDPENITLKLPYKLAPYKAAVFPLLKNKPELVSKAREIYENLRKDFMVAWDDRGNVGKRYYSQDEIGTPFCITVDFDSLEDGAVTIRNRDTKQQERIKIEEVRGYIMNQLM
ncbi:MAG: glycine--tRNA ligase [Candidatus Doudnabacteria bacterium]|nr:glycine--tRNA ligase [Candidatus Doudnabacteria bacterium]